jgi:ribose-phosphate pyrophosphokinase
VAINYFKHQNTFDFKNLVVVSPDAGGVGRAKKFKEQIQQIRPDIETGIQFVEPQDLAMIIKQREGAGKIGQMNLVG